MEQYGAQYGNPIRHTDEYGNAGGDDADRYGTTQEYMNQYGATATTGAYGTQGTGGITPGNIDVALDAGGDHLSSSSSPSSEDGIGGRRNKYRLKEKLPGGHHKDKQNTPAGDGYGEHSHEKKGMMKKTKEKLPGHH